jgi:hypothetical protein
MRFITSFKSCFPESSEFDHPRGYSICQFIRDELHAAGFEVSKPENYRDIAWSVDCIVKSKKLFFFVGYLGTKMTDWQLIVCSDAGLIRKMFGYNDKQEQLILSKAISEIMRRDERFFNLKWYPQYTDTPKDISFSDPEEMIIKR